MEIATRLAPGLTMLLTPGVVMRRHRLKPSLTKQVAGNSRNRHFLDRSFLAGAPYTAATNPQVLICQDSSRTFFGWWSSAHRVPLVVELLLYMSPSDGGLVMQFFFRLVRFGISKHEHSFAL